MKSPYVWFGGKRKVAPQVWDALGDVDNYVEPFFGSGAVLLGRPHDLGDGTRRAETINDADGFVSNFWRAVSLDPEAVAHYADYPVNETDLFARHLWLVNEGRSRLLEGMESDPEWYDAKIAGWWVWGVNAWIGSGWCSGEGPWTHTENGIGKRPHLGNAGQGVNRKLPHLGDAGQAGFNNLEYRRDGITAYFVQLANRLRDTRVCNGDWSRVVTSGALSFGATVGVFLDPPYLGDVRTADLYAVDDHHIAHEVREWCLANGDNKRLRIVLAGYTDEHDHLMPASWRRVYWSSSAAYQTTNAAEKAAQGEASGNLANRHKECLWLSPHCLVGEDGDQLDLFGGAL
jgi:site-specific DNA-adenine methylase